MMLKNKIFILLFLAILCHVIFQGCLPPSLYTKKICKKESSIRMTGADTGLREKLDINGIYDSPRNGAIKFFPNGEIIWGRMAGVYSCVGDTIKADLYIRPHNIIFGEWSLFKFKFIILNSDRIRLHEMQNNDTIEFKFKEVNFSPRLPSFIYSEDWLWNNKNTRKKYERDYNDRKKDYK